MKRSILILFLVVGCTRTPTTRPKDATDVKERREDPLGTAVSILRRAESTASYREALDYCNAHIKKKSPPSLSLSAAEREILAKRFGLVSDDVEFVADIRFRPLDAHHLESSYVLRDAARSIRQEQATPVQQARLAFDWMTRRIMPAEHHATLMPSHMVLSRAYGNAWERALVFLDVLRQFELEGCIITAASGAGPLLYAGVVVPDGDRTRLALFDVRAGTPVMNSAGDIATLDQLGKNEDLHVYAVASLQALAPRMKYLQDQLAARDPVMLAVDAGEHLKSLETAGGREVAVWSSHERPHGAPDGTPLFALRTEGSTEQASRFLKFSLIPWPQISRVYEDLRLLNGLTPDAGARLLQISQITFEHFVFAPREFLIRGQYDRIHRRLEGIQSAINDLETARIDGGAFVQRVVEWRDRINAVYLELIRAQQAENPQAINAAQLKIERTWSEDQYFVSLLSKDGVPKAAGDTSNFREMILPKGVLTFVLLAAMHEPLDQECIRLFAQKWQEKAENAQAAQELRAQPSAPGSAEEKARRSAWSNARGHWNRYVDRFYFFPASLQVRIAHIQDRLNRNDAKAALQWSHILFDYVSKAAQAKQALARAERFLGNHDLAEHHLKALIDDLTAMQKNDAVAAALTRGADTLYADAFQGLANDFGEAGALQSLRLRAERELQQLRGK